MQCASYAKINLFLEVLGKTQDEYHQVETLLCTIDLHDNIKYALTKKRGVKMWANLPELAAEDNLVYKVASRIEAVHKPRSGVEITLEKIVPIAAGLGGGSSNAANAIMVLADLWELDLDAEEKGRIASSLGSDINFFLRGGTAWGTGRGEVINGMDDIMLDNILLVNPKIRISSSEAYRLVKIPESSDRKVWDPSDPRRSCFNRLEAGISCRYPEIVEILGSMLRFGAWPALMSGSGSTCFGVFDSMDDLISCQQYHDGKGHWTYATRTISRDEYQSVFKA
jgi:4-diphosphocytidyl-2-C-methyl-D-erythritol kinase